MRKPNVLRESDVMWTVDSSYDNTNRYDKYSLLTNANRSKANYKIVFPDYVYINYNIFHKDEFTQSYPYCIEDSSISFILYYYNIAFINNNNFYTHNKCLTNCLCWCSQDTWHTNVPNLKWRL